MARFYGNQQQKEQERMQKMAFPRRPKWRPQTLQPTRLQRPQAEILPSPEARRTPTCLPVGTPATRIDFTSVCEEQAVVLTTHDLADGDRMLLEPRQPGPCGGRSGSGGLAPVHPHSSLSEATRTALDTLSTHEGNRTHPKKQAQQLLRPQPLWALCLPHRDPL